MSSGAAIKFIQRLTRDDDPPAPAPAAPPPPPPAPPAATPPTPPPDPRIGKLEGQIDDLTKLVRHLQAQLTAATDPRGPIFLAKDGAAAGEWIEQTVNGSTIAALTGGRECDDDTHATALIDPADSDAYFVVEMPDGAGGVPRKYLKIGGGSRFRYVSLTSTSGAAGDNTTAASWVYTADDVDSGEELATGLAYGGRTWPIKAAVATFGILHVASDGTKTLLYANEAPTLGAC